MTKKLSVYFIIISISFFLGFYLFEIYLIYKFQNTKITNEIRFKKAKEMGIYFDNRSKSEVIKDYKKKNIDAYPTIHPIHFLKNELIHKYKIIPLAGYPNKVTIFNNEFGYYEQYQSDRYGFNNKDYLWDNKHYKYVFIGDSFVHGAGIKNENNLIGIFKKKTKIEALNLGIGGNGPLIEYATLLEYVDFNKVKNLIWFFYSGNDLQNLSAELETVYLSNYLNDGFSQNLKNNQNKVNNFIIEYIESEKKKIESKKEDKNKGLNLFVNSLKLLQIRKIISNSSYFTKNEVHEFINIINKLNEICKRKNINFYFVYLPTYEAMIDKAKNKSNINNKQIIFKFLETKNIPFIDIESKMLKKNINPKNYYPFGLQGHFNKLGNEIIITSLIEEFKLYD